MKIYKVGPLEFDKYDLEDLKEDEHLFEWLVYYYTDESVDNYGQLEFGGEAVALHEDGLLYVVDLFHGSMNGPVYQGIVWMATPYTVEKFLSDKDDITEFDARKEVKDKVRELLSLEVKS